MDEEIDDLTLTVQAIHINGKRVRRSFIDQIPSTHRFTCPRPDRVIGWVRYPSGKECADWLLYLDEKDRLRRHVIYWPHCYIDDGTERRSEVRYEEQLTQLYLT